MSGIFILSLDTEIAWGTYSPAALKARSHAFDTYRETLPRLVKLLDDYDIPATWAVVSHLFLEPGQNTDVLRPHYSWWPAPDDIRAPNPAHPDWYHAPDMIRVIRAAKTQHEIGTHTFSHVIAGDPAVTPEIWHSQMRATAELHAAQGLPLRSIVYPQNRIAYLDTLSQYGIIAYRGIEQNWYAGTNGVMGRLYHLVDAAAANPPPTYDLDSLREGELVNLPASQFLMTYDGPRTLIPTASRIRQAQLGLDRAVKQGRLYHLWFHPFNLGQGTPGRMFAALEAILEDVSHRRERGDIRIMTMEQAATWILNGMPDE
ncbi:MAG: polysaccharide deacetylase family protein [Burkholderiales bacterium]|nr:polysaccharide deacetylase family protein [Anaerolineae bacterium]